MFLILKSFRSLYFATLLMLLGTGLLNTYLALRVAETADGLWVGALMTANYLGLVLGGKLGHRLIARVGHIRAYVACAGVITAAVLGHGLSGWLPAWLLLRVLIGLCTMCQYMVIESWLNEQASSDQRGQVFSGYMAASYLGLVLGQLVLVASAELGPELLMLVALCFSLCLVPVALTRKLHPTALHSAPLDPRFFFARVPLSLITIVVAGLLIGSFYGLAPLYGTRMGLSTEQVGLFMGCCILAGMFVQWPLGWLSDRRDRVWLIGRGGVLLALAALPLAVLPEAPLWLLFTVGALVCMLQFSLYPLAVALANDHVGAERRVSLTAMLLLTFGVGASLGPLLAGVMMRFLGANMLYAFVCGCAVLLAWRVQPWRVNHLHEVAGAPLHHVLMPDSTSSSPLAAALDPRVDEQMVQEQMVDEATPAEEGAVKQTTPPAPEVAHEQGAQPAERGHADKSDEHKPAAQ
ncbi:MAG: putative MFS-type transporter YcaD [Candidatus Accumulibacter appositus]|uniref:Putative MFS-type transporter YcaD n=1 Tax=Candidatus Accumulibacter appositus TaxID=1454003 RepID=A0A011QLL8_9PROT|nr:MFS transporter [Accumulibacter sp.]EXI79769.1 MAG: putative MFS-type transporter YcaD [Candidatus Accumulibacter appositus]HRF05175.1 MFS transporter [Accumulibacter sp.]